MKTSLKIAIVLLGYLAALGFGFLANELHEWLAPDWANQSSGMYAEGGAILFFEVTGVACVVPTLLALFFLRKVPWFWNTYSWAMLALALSGPLLEAVGIGLNRPVNGPAPVMSTTASLFFLLVLVRIFSVLFLAPADLLSALLSADPKCRRRLLIAFALECALGIFVLLNIATRHKFM
ncbi:MAG TPA: hypothetical protein VHE12_06420 [bacterium]|nr:hypothetical protein [bacterium]